jgi:hypothetical protein
MSQSDSTGRRLRAGFSLASLAGSALAAAALSMGTAHADTPIVDVYSSPDPYDVLFGAEGGTTANSQGADNALLDTNLATSNPTGDATFMNDVAAFEANPAEHGIENLINAIDPSAFAEQVGGGAVGTIASAGDAYLVPESALGYLAVGLDYGLLTPTGLDFVLTPLIDVLLGQPFG